MFLNWYILQYAVTSKVIQTTWEKLSEYNIEIRIKTVLFNLHVKKKNKKKLVTLFFMLRLTLEYIPGFTVWTPVLFSTSEFLLEITNNNVPFIYWQALFIDR